MERANFVSKKAVQREIDAGNVTMARSPFHPKLVILNYTKQAQFEQNWSEIVQICRGLVVEWPRFGDKAPIVIDAPRKFFNNGEPGAPDLTTWDFRDIYITEKLDGYYISVRRDSEYGLIVTSRGSFDNQYVEAAKKMIPRGIPNDVDYFCELCQDFPGDENIIVTRHPIPRLVCWGVGKFFPTPSSTCGWNGEVAKEITQAQFKQYMTSRVEGVVAFNRLTGERVKVKTQWYLGMHRAISRCTFKDVLEVVVGGGKIAGQKETEYVDYQGEKQSLTLSMLPEEHYGQMCKWEDEIWQCHAYVSLIASTEYDNWKSKTPKEYAAFESSEPDIKSIVFAMMNGKDYGKIYSLTWNVVKKRLLRNSANKNVVVTS